MLEHPRRSLEARRATLEEHFTPLETRVARLEGHAYRPDYNFDTLDGRTSPIKAR